MRIIKIMRDFAFFLSSSALAFAHVEFADGLASSGIPVPTPAVVCPDATWKYFDVTKKCYKLHDGR